MSFARPDPYGIVHALRMACLEGTETEACLLTAGRLLAKYVDR